MSGKEIEQHCVHNSQHSDTEPPHRKWVRTEFVPEWNFINRPESNQLKPSTIDREGIQHRVAVEEPKIPPSYDSKKNPFPCVMKQVKLTADKPILTNKFDLLRFVKYQEVKARLYAAQRHEDIVRGMLKRNKPLEDTEIREEMILMYGEMDVETAKFQVLFENFKESYLQHIQECKIEENAFFQCKDPKVDVQFGCTTKLRKEIKWKFTNSEIELFESLNPKASKCRADWLQLPRPYRKWELEVLEESLCSENLKPLQNIQIPTNISIMDLSYCKFSAWININGSCEGKSALFRTLSELIHEFPCGVTPDVFWETFFTKFGYRIKITDTHYASLAEIFKEKDLFYVVRTDQTILFPASFKEQIAPISLISARLRHLILRVLSMSKGYIEVDNIPQTILMFFGTKLMWYDWGFMTILEFVTSLMQNNTELVTVDSIMIPTESTMVQHYLIINTPHYLEIFRKLKATLEIEKKHHIEKLNAREDPPEMIKYLDSENFISNCITPGDMLRCKSCGVFSPFKFTLILARNCDALEFLQTALQNDASTETDGVLEKNNSLSMMTGVLVLCFCAVASSPKEWYRGRIIFCLPNDRYRVRLLDFGSEVIVPIEDIRYLRRELIEEERFQGIVCKLRMPVRFDKYRGNSCTWTLEHKEVFKTLLSKGEAFVKFHSCIKDKLMDQTWEVTLTIVDRNTSDIIVTNVAQAVEQKYLNSGLEVGEASVFKPINLVWAAVGN